MPDILIAAIARIADEANLKDVLAQCAGLDARRVTLFTTGHVGEMDARVRTHFIPSQHAPLASGSHGTSVPGTGRTFALNAYAMDAARVDHLKDIGISPDAAHYYNIAIDEGRSVVTYVTSAENATFVEERFRSCGFKKIRRFPCSGDFARECATELL
jgi:hypothetical protein